MQRSTGFASHVREPAGRCTGLPDRSAKLGTSDSESEPLSGSGERMVKTSLLSLARCAIGDLGLLVAGSSAGFLLACWVPC